MAALGEYTPVLYEPQTGSRPKAPTQGCNAVVKKLRNAQAQYDKNDEGHIVPVANKKRIFYCNKHWPADIAVEPCNIFEAIDRVANSAQARRVMVQECLHEQKEKGLMYRKYYNEKTMLYWSHSFVTYLEYVTFAGIVDAKPTTDFEKRLRREADDLPGGAGGPYAKRSIDQYSSSPNMLMKCLFVDTVRMINSTQGQANAADIVLAQLQKTLIQIFKLYTEMYTALVNVHETISNSLLGNLPPRLNPFHKDLQDAVKRVVTPAVYNAGDEANSSYALKIRSFNTAVHTFLNQTVDETLRLRVDTAKRKRTLERMQHHRVIHSHDLKKATMELHTRIYGKSTDWTEVQVNQANVSAALVLLTLCYGPRSLGATLMNYITPRIGVPLDVYNDLDENAESDANMYGAPDYVIFVHQLTKQASIEKQVIKDITRVQQVEVTEENFAEAIANMEEGKFPEEGNSRPILWFFMLPITTTKFSIEKAVQHFMVLFTRTREYIFQLDPSLPWRTHRIQQYLPDESLLKAVDIDHKYVQLSHNTTTAQRKKIQSVHKKLYNSAKDLQVELFQPLITAYRTGPTQMGMHDLRRMYASAAYHAFGNVYTLPTEFTRTILHHKDHSSSLLYQMLQVVDRPEKYNTTKSINNTTTEHIGMILTRLEKLIKEPQLVTQILFPPEKEVVTLHDNDHYPYHIPQLTRAPRGLSEREKLNRTIEHIRNHVGDQNIHNFKWTGQILRRLNVNTLIIDSVLDNLLSDDERQRKRVKSQKSDDSNLTKYVEQDF